MRQRKSLAHIYATVLVLFCVLHVSRSRFITSEHLIFAVAIPLSIQMRFRQISIYVRMGERERIFVQFSEKYLMCS